MILKLKARYSIKILQVYSSTTDHSHEETNIFYDEINSDLQGEIPQITQPRRNFLLQNSPYQTNSFFHKSKQESKWVTPTNVMEFEEFISYPVETDTAFGGTGSFDSQYCNSQSHAVGPT